MMNERTFFPALFNDAFFSDWAEAPAYSRYAPAVDIYEMQDKYVVHADVPGVEEKDLKVEFHDGQLVLEGKRNVATECDPEKKECTPLMRERRSAQFRRVFTFGDGVEAERIEAAYRNGTLTVTLPKARQVLPKVIPISIKK